MLDIICLKKWADDVRTERRRSGDPIIRLKGLGGLFSGRFLGFDMPIFQGHEAYGGSLTEGELGKNKKTNPFSGWCKVN